MEGVRLVMLSHLVWEERLFQRPQHLATQFAKRGASVQYFGLSGYRRWAEMHPDQRVIPAAKGLEATNVPTLPFSTKFAPMRWLTEQQLTLRTRSALLAGEEGKRVLWLQSPRFLSVARRAKPDLLVYDAMDPHAQFRTSSPEVARQEDELLREADVVFAGGKSLHQALLRGGREVHCHPSGIDFEHFASAAADGPVPEDIAGLKSPVLGYIGAIDERIDWDLVKFLATERAHWNFVFLGPLVIYDKFPLKMDNVYWLGAQPYRELPGYLRAFDVCLLPWLVNDLTRAMSPTKTPEYLASGRPVVSVAIPDLVEEYGDVVAVAASHQDFLACCTKALMAGKGTPVRAGATQSWGEIAAAMSESIYKALAEKQRG